jgi:hypothetical protein
MWSSLEAARLLPPLTNANIDQMDFAYYEACGDERS